MSKRGLRDFDDLTDNNLTDPANHVAIKEVIDKFSMEVTPHVLNVIKTADKNNAISAQFVPNIQELQEHPDELTDPIGDEINSPLPGVIHRYKDRVLFNTIQTCAVYCRFCFRRENVGPGEGGLTPSQIDDAIDYVRQHNEIWEVILSGGDPLVLSPRRLASLIERLSAIQHVGIIRLHTRVPCVAPEKITPDVISALKKHTAVYIVIHTNHADEITPEVSEKLAVLADAGIPLLSQTVLLKDINDNPDTLTALFRRLLENRVKPYYLHHGDLAKGTGHFRTTIKKCQDILKKMRGPVSGLCQPHYVLDLPGGHGKVPVGHQYLHELSEGSYQIDDVHGGKRIYKDATEQGDTQLI